MKVVATRERYHELVQHIGAEFQRTGQGQPLAQGQQALLTAGEFSVELDRLTLVARWERLERLAGEWFSLAWCTADPVDEHELRRWAEDVVAHVRYLSEPLRVWEIDQVDPAAVVRSTEPVPAAQGREYFELIRRPSGGELRRYQVRADGQRQAVSFLLVHDMLFRLLADLAIAASPTG